MDELMSEMRDMRQDIIDQNEYRLMEVASEIMQKMDQYVGKAVPRSGKGRLNKTMSLEGASITMLKSQIRKEERG